VAQRRVAEQDPSTSLRMTLKITVLLCVLCASAREAAFIHTSVPGRKQLSYKDNLE